METVPFEVEFLGGLLGGLLVGVLALVFVSAIFVYIYTSWAHMSIAKRVSLSHPGIAWIPYFGPIIVAFRISKMHWWPWLIFVAAVLLSVGFGATEMEGVGEAISGLLSLVFWVFVIIWTWKMFEALRRPGWWALMLVVPFIGWIIYLVFLGITAWGKSPQGPREGGSQFAVDNNPQVSQTPQTPEAPETPENHFTPPSDR